ITLKGVPLLLITSEGIGWIASQVGEPTGKFVRDGLDVKVCVIVGSAETKTEIPVKLGSLGEAVIEVEYPQARVYKAPTKAPLKRWVAKQPASTPLLECLNGNQWTLSLSLWQFPVWSRSQLTLLIRMWRLMRYLCLS
ncbi:hypothetical protein LINGRAHAP2_LOCUS10751, partial [Linum grandiflorum]